MLVQLWYVSALVRAVASFLEARDAVRFSTACSKLRDVLCGTPLTAGTRFYNSKQLAASTTAAWTWSGCNLYGVDGGSRLQSRTLRVLTLESCYGLDPQNFTGERLPNLTGLNLKTCSGTRDFTLVSNTLESFALESCSDVQRVTLHTPYLKRFAVKTCDHFSELYLPNVLRLESVDLALCPKLLPCPDLGRCTALLYVSVFHLPAWTHFHAAPSIVSVGVSYSPVSMLYGLQRCSNLKTLSAVACQYLTEIPPLRDCRSLSVVCLAGSGVESLDFLSGNASVTRVDATECDALKCVEALRECTALQQLSLASCPFVRPSGLDYLAGLTTLDLRYTSSQTTPKRTLSALALLTASPLLEQLLLTYNHIFKFGRECRSVVMCKLRELDVSHSEHSVASQGELDLPQCPELAVLKLNGLLDVKSLSTQPWPGLCALELQFSHVNELHVAYPLQSLNARGAVQLERVVNAHLVQHSLT